MKGVVFTEFFEMIEAKHGYAEVDRLLRETEDVSGHYTSVGTYDHNELVRLMLGHAAHMQVQLEDLLVAFGKHLLAHFSKAYPDFFRSPNVFTFLRGINEAIHREVLKLYPDAQLPHFDIEDVSDTELKMIYHSDRSMSHLGLGLIYGVISYFGEPIDVEHALDNESGSEATFILRIRA